MMLKGIIALFLFAFSSISAQEKPELQRKIIMKIDTLLGQYITYSTFIMPNEKTVSDAAVTRFKSLFKPGTTVINDLYSVKPASGKSGSIKIDMYADKVKHTFSKGLIIKVKDA